MAEEEAIMSRRRKVRMIITNQCRSNEWCCVNDECEYITNNNNDAIKHEIEGARIDINIDLLYDFIEDQQFKQYLKQVPRCKVCNKTFNTNNLLSQHQNRGKKFGCLDKTLKETLSQCSVEEKLQILDYTKNLMNKKN